MTRRINSKAVRNVGQMLAKEKGVSGAPGMGVQANISWNKMHQQFEADGKINAPPPNKKTSRWSGLILNTTIVLLVQKGAHSWGQPPPFSPRANGGRSRFRPAAAPNGAVRHAASNQAEERPLVKSGGDCV